MNINIRPRLLIPSSPQRPFESARHSTGNLKPASLFSPSATAAALSWTRFAKTPPRIRAQATRGDPEQLRRWFSVRRVARGQSPRPVGRSSAHATVRVSGVPLFAWADLLDPGTPGCPTRRLNLHNQRSECDKDFPTGVDFRCVRGFCFDCTVGELIAQKGSQHLQLSNRGIEQLPRRSVHETPHKCPFSSWLREHGCLTKNTRAREIIPQRAIWRGLAFSGSRPRSVQRW